jgi:hypothetical protein
MKYLPFLLVLISLNVNSQSTNDTIPILNILLNNRTVLKKEIYIKLDINGSKNYYINKLTNSQIIMFDSLFVTGYKLEYFNLISLDCGWDCWIEKSTCFDKKILNSIRRQSNCRRVVFSIMLKNIKTEKEMYINNLTIYKQNNKK